MADADAAGPASEDNKKRFEVKKWNAVALWAWGLLSIIIVDIY
jgi:hypothetical protein